MPEQAREESRPLGLALVAWASMWLSSAGEPVWWVVAGIGVVALGVVSRLRRSWYWAALALLAAVCLASGVVRVWASSSGPVRELAREGAVASVVVVLDSGGRSFEASGPRPAFWVTHARLVSVEARGRAWRSGARVEVSASGAAAAQWSAVPLGTTVRATVRLDEPDPGAGDATLARAREPPVTVAPPGLVPAGVRAVRDGLREASAGLVPDARALLPALVVGDTTGMDEDLTERFRATGLTHLTAVSGANLTLLLAFLRVAAVAMGVRGRWLQVVLITGVAAFVVLCLGEPSVVRAAAMGLVGLAAMGWAGRGRHGLRFLAVAVLVLVVLDPWMSRSYGFALSVTACLGLLVWASRWTEALARWLPRWCAEAVAVPLAAQLATQPIVVALSGQVSLVGVLANMLAGPLVGPATVLGFVAAGVSVIWLPAAAAVAWVAGAFAQGLCWIARLGDTLPGAAVPWPATWPAVALMTVASLCAAAAAPLVLEHRWVALPLSGVLVVALLRTPAPPGWPPHDWQVVFCDVGQGDATVFRVGEGQAVIVDAGPDPRALASCLDGLGVRSVPLVVTTHLHADHVGGLPALTRRGTHTVLGSSVRTPSGGDALVAGLGARRPVAVAGEAWTLGETRIEVLAAPVPRPYDLVGDGESTAENDASLLLRVESGGLTVLIAGDAEDTGQELLVGLGDRLDVDVLLVPHHGSARQSESFLQATRPQVAVVSVGADNDYGHPTARTLRLASGLATRVIRTDQEGAVALRRAEDARLWVTTQR